MPDWLPYLGLFAAGLVAGALNVVAGGGSFLTLPLLIFLGLPPTVANGTNRVAILLQNVGAVWGFSRHRLLGGGWLVTAALPAAVGAVAGTAAALEVGDEAFKKLLAVLMVVVTLWTLADPLGRLETRRARSGALTGAGAGTGGGRMRSLGLAAGFFVAGVYAGFVQAGVGFLLLAVTTLAGLDLVRGNAVKVLVVLVATPVSLALFAAQGKVDWAFGLALAAGNVAGALAGVRLTVLKGHRWVKAVVTVAVIVFAIKLWFFD